MIPSGGEFRPDDAITRAEMATFLIGLLAEGAPNVTINQDGVILLGTGGAAEASRRLLRRCSRLGASLQRR